jgi:hypothetical protein
MVSVINTGLKNQISGDWKAPKASRQSVMDLGWYNYSLLGQPKPITSSKSEPIKASIDRVLKETLTEAKTLSDKEITDMVWAANIPDPTSSSGGSKTNPNYNSSKTEKGVKD